MFRSLFLHFSLFLDSSSLRTTLVQPFGVEEYLLMDLWTGRGGAGQEEEGGTNGEVTMEAYTPPHVRQPMGICCVTRGSQPGAL